MCEFFRSGNILSVMKRALKIVGVAAALFALLLLALTLYYLGVTAGVRLDAKKLTMPTACIRLYDTHDDEIPAAISVSTTTHALPNYVKEAFVAVEDKRFYEHHGIDMHRMLGALWHNLKSFSFREGASTISQQLIKNTHLSSEKTIVRKLKEIRLARALEKKYSKDEILTLYLNSIYFGHSAFGIGQAAQFYFGKTAEELDIAESAMLAAIVRSPNRYSPFRDAERCLARRNLVLTLMQEQGLLSEEQAAAAKEAPLPQKPAAETQHNAYLTLVLQELADLFPDAGSGGWGTLHVHTAYDPALQEAAEQVQCDTDSCVLVRDNRRNSIVALASTVGTPMRSPASAIKPLLVYAPAMEENLICPATPVLDARTDFGGYSPDDYGGATDQYMSVRDALAHSANIPAVRILNELGIERATEYLAKMGIRIRDEDKTLALALGGMRNGIRLPLLADGYAVFANGGTYAASKTIERVTNDSGKTLYARSDSGQQVFSKDVCWLMNDMLMTTAKQGTARRLKSLPFPVCAKTGTAGTEKGNTDAYCISYTSDHVIAVWMGNADGSVCETTGGGLPANEVLRLNRALYAKTSPKPFFDCNDVVRLGYDKLSYEQDHTLLLSDPAAPPYTDPQEFFRIGNNLPHSTRYSLPNIAAPTIFLKEGKVQIVLCQTEYYDYEVIRENRGEKTTIYQGKYRNAICDNSVRSGETYVYTVIPTYQGHVGTPVTLPSVTVPKKETLPDDWWIQ